MLLRHPGDRFHRAALAIALGPLAFIYVGMWKRWALEGVGWAILVVFIVLAFFT